MNYKVILLKDSDCEICKLVQEELTDNPPAADIEIIKCNQDMVNQIGFPYDVDYFPTVIVINPDNVLIARFEGFVDSNSIDINIKEDEAKHLV